MAEDYRLTSKGRSQPYRSYRSGIYVARGLVIRLMLHQPPPVGGLWGSGRQCSSREWRRAASMESDTDLEYYRVLGSRNDQTLRCLLYFNLAPKLPSCGTHSGRSPPLHILPHPYPPPTVNGGDLLGLGKLFARVRSSGLIATRTNIPGCGLSVPSPSTLASRPP